MVWKLFCMYCCITNIIYKATSTEITRHFYIATLFEHKNTFLDSNISATYKEQNSNTHTKKVFYMQFTIQNTLMCYKCVYLCVLKICSLIKNILPSFLKKCFVLAFNNQNTYFLRCFIDDVDFKILPKYSVFLRCVHEWINI